jgi:hypothetical protein
MSHDCISISQVEAARLSGLSAKTLERRTLEGAPTGRRTVGRRVVFVLEEFKAWLSSLPTQKQKATEA